jgi:hypothetical protein
VPRARILRRRPARLTRSVRRARSIVRASPPAPWRQDDPYADVTLEEFDYLIKAAGDAARAERPQPGPEVVERWVKPIRRWLSALAADVGATIDAFERRASISRSFAHPFVRKIGPGEYVASVPWQRLERELAGVVSDLYEEVGASAFGAVSQEVGVALDPRVRETLAPGIDKVIGQQVKLITESSRQDLAGAVQTAVERGYSAEQLTRGVKGDGFAGLRGMVDRWQAVAAANTTTDRAHLIALTETANAYNLGALDAYQASGLVTEVNVFDGESCGWTTHSDPDSANGKRVPIEEARSHPISHPHCQRAFGAVVAGAPPVGAPGAQTVRPPQVGPRPTLPAGPAGQLDLRARATMARVFDQAATAEPSVTGILQGLESSTAGRLEGLPFRLKADGERTIDKILEDVAQGKELADAAKVRDALRYTMLYDERRYWTGLEETHRRLRAEGNVLIKGQGNWLNAVSKDVNTAWRTPEGARFELQFHTPASYARKTTRGPWGRSSHEVYEEWRALDPADQVKRRERLVEELTSIWDDCPLPEGEAFDLASLVFPD